VITPYVNAARPPADRSPFGRQALEFHRTIPGYRPTELRRLDSLARKLGIAELLLKDESSRLGLPSFKILGAAWAIRQALGERLGIPGEQALSFDELRERSDALRPLGLAAATDGNHGRAVARVASMLGLSAHIFVPDGTAPARIEAIEQEGARLDVVPGGYDEAVARSAACANERCLVISDTSWPGYERVPRWVIEGYSTILWELEDQLQGDGGHRPDVVLAQIGVGAFAAAVATHPLGPSRSSRTVAVEPERAACVLESLHAGRIVTLTHAQDSIMAGLKCGTPSVVAWPELAAWLDASIAIADERARQAMRLLAHAGVVAGEAGAAGLGGLLELLQREQLEPVRASLGVGPHTRALIFCTEGATDPAAYRAIVGEYSTASSG
jgi:diaminopropionate ammonia-lyase